MRIECELVAVCVLVECSFAAKLEVNLKFAKSHSATQEES